MIKKPLPGREPNGYAAIKAMETYEKVSKVGHLAPDEFRIEDDRFIPRSYRMRGFVLCPNITNQGLLYRGDAVDIDETNNIPPKYSSATVKEQSLEDRLYRRMRWEDLGLTLLRSHPIYRLLSGGIKLPWLRGEYFRISTTTLLHSYGVSSPYISLTSDKEIALFYAVTDYDEEKKRFIPTKKKYGVLSSYHLIEPFHQTSRVFPVGLQVYDRPGLNKEFTCRLRPFEDFFNLPEVHGLLFFQDRNLSEYMLNKFEGGEKLCPMADALSKKMEQSKGCVLETTYKRFQKRYPQYEVELGRMREKYHVTDGIRDALRFASHDLADQYEPFDYWWYEFCKKINFEANKILYREYFENIPYDVYYSRYFQFVL